MTAGNSQTRPPSALRAIDDAEFAAALDRLGPFEPAPVLAVAVSGGADSLALTLLADRWARARGGHVVALTVDHRLRAEAAREAVSVAAWLGIHGIRHETLVWHGPYPPRGIQAAAREARYGLLGAWCRAAGVLHLLTAHHLDDQAETLILRLGRGSGLAGLAGMAAIAEHDHYRLLRPLLALPAARLRATLFARNQPWIEDPSNRDPAYARVRVRAGRADLAQAGLTPQRLADTCRHLARARVVLERATDRLLAHAVMLHPGGFAVLDPAALAAGEAEIRLRAMAALVATVGGADYTPRFERIERLVEAVAARELKMGRTLGGCRILPWRGRVLIHRELAAMAPAMTVPEHGEGLWDGRFLVARTGTDLLPAGLYIAGLGAHAAIERGKEGGTHFPASMRATLPALWQDGRLVAVPHLGWRWPDTVMGVYLRFRPARPLSNGGFAVV